MSRKKSPSRELLEELKLQLRDAEVRLDMSKRELYKYTADGKLLESEFEAARIRCIVDSARLGDIIREIARVERALLKEAELPFGE